MKKYPSQSSPDVTPRRPGDKGAGQKRPRGPALPTDVQALVHQLQVQRMELELQNEELQLARRQAEEALSKYADLYEFSPIALLTFDGAGKILEVNLTGSALLSSGKNFLIHKNFQRLLTPDSRPIFNDFYKKVLESGAKQKCEVKIRRGDKTVFHAQVKGRLGEQTLAKEREVRIAIIDITEQKRAAQELDKYRRRLEELVEQRTEELRKSEIKFRTLTENLTDMVYRSDPEALATTYVNSAIEKLYGYSASAWLENPDLWEKSIHPEDRVRVLAEFEEARKKKKEAEITYRIVRKDKTVRWVRDSFAWEKDEKGRVVSLNGILSDITERKKIDEELEEYRQHLEKLVGERTVQLNRSEELFRIAAQSASDLIYEWDILTNRLEWFGDIDQRLGYVPGEFPRTIEAWAQAIHPGDHDRVMHALERHLKNREVWDMEYRIKKKDGTYSFWVDRGTALWDKNGNPYKMIGSCSDITLRQQHK